MSFWKARNKGPMTSENQDDQPSTREQTSTKPSNENRNVLGKPLALFSKSPMTGYKRDGYCRTGPDDPGNHAVAGVVTDEFLDFSASKGNDLRKQVGLKDGTKWCLCTSRWIEAFEAMSKGQISEKGVPKVFIHATHESALKSIDMKDLRRFAADGEAPNQLNRQETHVNPEKGGGPVKEV